ncbi:MAG: hypothetical protein PHO42_03175 [Candidatus Omnitrophica bacterium]|nr:hypothetical protein [Candidatus Omnitrophota bacterium]
MINIIIEWTKPILISVLTAIITVKLSLKKFRSEKWWERKADTYSKIIEVIHQLKNYAEQKLKVEYKDIELSPQKEQELARQYEEAHKELIKALDIGSFIISEKALKVLETYQNRPRLSWEENALFDIIEQDIKHLKECLCDFKKAAKKDLKLK